MKGKFYRYILLFSFFIVLSHNPDSIEGKGLDKVIHTPENSRIRNDYNPEGYYSYIDRSFDYFMRYWEINGASVAIVRDGRLVFARGYGLADTTRHIVMEPYHKFRIASISKLVTATAIMKLQSEKKLSLRDKIFGPDGILDDEYYDNPKDPRACDITIAHLLAHQGGWNHGYGDHMFMPGVVADFLGKELPVTTEDIIRFALDKRLHFTPGKGRSYSNLGYAILGLVIEEVSGMPYEDYCTKELFEPLGIYDFELARNLYENRDPYEVSYYEHSDALPKESIYGTGELLPAPYGGNDIEALGGAGAWITTAPDLLKFVMSIDGLDRGEELLPESSIEFMTNKANGFAPVGWKATADNGNWWRTGSFAGTSAMVKRTPDGTLWAVLLNTSTWKSSMFTTDINILMSRLIRNTHSWPDTDLFTYQLPVPVDYYPMIHN